MATLPKQLWLELTCVVDGETHAVEKLDYVQLTDEKGTRSTMQPIAYCGTKCGYCDVAVRTVAAPSESAITCDACKNERRRRAAKPAKGAGI